MCSTSSLKSTVLALPPNHSVSPPSDFFVLLSGHGSVLVPNGLVGLAVPSQEPEGSVRYHLDQ